MTSEEFVRDLKQHNERLLAKLDAAPEVTPAGDPRAGLAPLLKAALKNEAEAAAIAAEWVGSTPELEAKLALARHAGDEARHYQLLEERVRALGLPLADWDPLTPPSPVLQFLRSLSTTEERIAAALVAREAMGGRRNVQFLRYLEAVGQPEIARLYRQVINPDEDRHHAAGCALLARLATSPEAQARARAAAVRLLEIGDQARDHFLRSTGATVMPGC